MQELADKTAAVAQLKAAESETRQQTAADRKGVLKDQGAWPCVMSIITLSSGLHALVS